MTKPELNVVPETGHNIEIAETLSTHLQSVISKSNYETMSEVDAKIAAAEARTDTKFAQVMGELKAIDKATSGTKATVVVTGIAVVGVVVAIVGWGSQMFGVGMNVDTVATQAAQKVDAANTQKIESLRSDYQGLDHKMSQVLKAVQAKAVPAPKP